MNKKLLIDLLINEREIPTDFSNQTIAEAHAIDRASSDINKEKRVDITARNLVTIDGEFAHDFDDAVECIRNDDNSFTLTVAIADVSHYVQQETELDLSAKYRGNSVYLPDRVIPMLPFKLSNHVCSLTPNQQKLCVVCEMQLVDGTVSSYRFYCGIMASSKRLSYNQCQEIFNTKQPEFSMLHDLAEATMELRKNRLACGSMLLNKPEKSCRLRDNEIIFEKKERNVAHFVIEEAMIAANRCAGHFLLSNNTPALYRIHNPPTAEKLQQLNKLLSSLNFQLPAKPTAADFSDLINKIEQRNPALSDAMLPYILGTLSRASYSPKHDIGHYGLAIDSYLYFTSPIRRYPDLINHRILISVLQGVPSPYRVEELMQIAEHCLTTEIRADKAEWDSRQRLLCSQSQNLVGCSFDGIISGISPKGVFVAISDLSIDGMIRLSSLPGYWEKEEGLPRLIRTADGEMLSLGDELTVKILAIDVEKGQVNLKIN